MLLAISPHLLIWPMCYAYLAWYYRKLNVTRLNIHESGERNFFETVFYFNHFLREIPIVTLYVLSAFWSVRAVYPDMVITGESGRFFVSVLLSILLSACVLGSCLTVGVKNTLMDFLQFRARNDQVFFGSHWQMHFLSTLVIILMLILPGVLMKGSAKPVLFVVFFSFSGLSLFFLTGRNALTDKRWLLHGAREVITFFWGALLPVFCLTGGRILSSPIRLSYEVLVIVILIAAILVYYLLVGFNKRGFLIADAGYPLAYLITSHFFEHFLDFIYMVLLFLLLMG